MSSGTPSTKPRQAVVLIHGIGEQRPMETLRGFVAAFLQEGTYYSKPDTLSESYELRRFKLRRASRGEGNTNDVNVDWPETDFYEYYWAHQMTGTALSHIVSWVIRIFRRSAHFLGFGPTEYPRLRRIARITWLVTLFVIAAIVITFKASSEGVSLVTTLSALAGIAAIKVVADYLPKFLLGAVIDFAGDAARYFDVNPKNVARRYDILRGGIALLKRLHEDGDKRGDKISYRYGRIILVGHSLGSVIAYDILNHYWHEVNGRIDVSDVDFSDLENYSGSNGTPAFSGAKPYDDASRFRGAQHSLWSTLNSKTPSGEALTADATRARWLISDLVTLGSPLAHAPVLIANGLKDLADKHQLRELATCPPDRSRHLNVDHFTVELSNEADWLVDYTILPHSAPFALTRWTNFWFPRDPIGGPLRVPFGSAIKDIELTDVSFWPVASHLSYWTNSASPCVQTICQILRDDATLS